MLRAKLFLSSCWIAALLLSCDRGPQNVIVPSRESSGTLNKLPDDDGGGGPGGQAAIYTVNGDVFDRFIPVLLPQLIGPRFGPLTLKFVKLRLSVPMALQRDFSLLLPIKPLEEVLVICIGSRGKAY